MSSPPTADRPATFAEREEAQERIQKIVGAGGMASAGAMLIRVQTTNYPLSPPHVFPFTYADPDSAVRRAVAGKFARLARNIQGVREVRVTETMPDLEVAVVMREEALDRELELRGIFIELVCDELDPSVGELYVYTEGEAPTWVREGALLT